MVDYIFLQTDRLVWNFSLSRTWMVEFGTLPIDDLNLDILKNKKIFHLILSKILVE